MQIPSAVLYVADLTSMAKFYADVFGLRPIPGEHGDVWQEFHAGAFRLGLHQIPREYLDTGGVRSAVTPRERTPIKLVFEVADLENVRTRLASLGVKVLVRPWGGCEV